MWIHRCDHQTIHLAKNHQQNSSTTILTSLTSARILAATFALHFALNPPPSTSGWQNSMQRSVHFYQLLFHHLPSGWGHPEPCPNSPWTASSTATFHAHPSTGGEPSLSIKPVGTQLMLIKESVPYLIQADMKCLKVLGSVVLLLLVVLLVLICSGSKRSKPKAKSLTSLRSKSTEQRWRWFPFNFAKPSNNFFYESLKMKIQLSKFIILMLLLLRWGEEEVTEEKALGPENFR